MGDSVNGWQTVLPSTHNRVERLDDKSQLELEAYERQTLEFWSGLDGGWSGCGKHTFDATEAKKLHKKLKQTVVQDLGFGGQGRVQKFYHTHKSKKIALARKHIEDRRRGIEILREEANVLERLCHPHIVKLIGTYSYQQRELYLILWPAATCDLSHLLADLDDLRFNTGDRVDILERLGLLHLDDTSAVDNTHHTARVQAQGGCPLSYLRRIMGCVTRAVDYCHASEIRHLDLKPQNILLSPGRVYLADFGISRDVHDQDHTRTYLENGSVKWLSPERLCPEDHWSMQSADIYSLGLVFLNMATVLYGARQTKLFDVLVQKDRQLKLQQLDQYLEDLHKLALVKQEFADETAHTFGPKHVVSLTRRMMSPEPSRRPTMAKVNAELVELGGIEQIYHSSCCKEHVRSLTQLLDRKYAQACDERRRLTEEKERMAKRLDILERAEETYNMRAENEHKRQASLVKQLAAEQQQRKQLEARLRELEQNGRRRPAMPATERSISGGLMMKPTRHTSKSPSQQFSMPVVSAAVPSLISTASSPRPVSPNNSRRPVPDMRKSADSLANFPLRSRGSGSRLPQPINPSTPIRASTPSTPRDLNLTDSTTNSMASSSFSRSSRRTTGSGLSPATTNSSPSASRILTPPDKPTIGTDGSAKLLNLISYTPGPKAMATAEAKPNAIDAGSVRDELSEHGESLQDVASQHGTEKSDTSAPMLRVPSLPVKKSWAAVAGDKSGLAAMFGSAVGTKKKV